MIRLRWRRAGRWIVDGLGAVAVLVAVVGLVAHEGRTAWQPLIIAAAAAHQLFWAAPVGVICFGLTRRGYLVGASFLVLVLAVISQAPLYFGRTATDASGGITVLQANLRVGSADPVGLTAMVIARHVDLLMTEELTPTERDRLIADGLARDLPYRFDAALAGGGGGLAIWSRYPLSDEHNYPGFELGVLQATVQFSAGHTATVLAIHLLPPYPYPAGEWLKEIRHIQPLLADAANGDGPVIAAGDFNATTDHAQFRKLLTRGYGDAAEHCGAGYLASYPTDRWFPPLIAIDHVLSRNAPADDVHTLALPGSDHRALLAHLALTSS
jgi:endonuclease/exonuclease/phosphatase (EEP) superfamily protein YafD